MRDLVLIIHFIGLAMGLGTSFAMMFLSKVAAKMEPSEAGKFMINASALARMGQIGLLLLVLSGGQLMTPYWSNLGNMPYMIAKLVLVLVLGALIGIMGSAIKKAKKGEPQQMLKVKKLGPIAFITSITIVILAVFTFH